MSTTSKTLKTQKAAADSAHAAFEQVTAASSDAMRSNMDRSMAAMSEVSAFGKENMEAWMASATAAQKGMEAVGARAVAFTKSALESHMAATRALMTSKSVQELVERQAEYARSSFDTYVAELNAMSDMVAGVTKDAIKPLNERMTAMSSLMQNGVSR